MTTASPTSGPRPPTSGLPLALQDGEQVMASVRRHWLYLWPRLVFMTLVALVPPAAIAFLMSEAGAYEGVGAQAFWVAAGLYLVFWAVRIFLTWYSYNHDVWIVTNQRLIDSHKKHPFSLKLSSADLVNVQDMTVERDGILRTIFDFGDIVCQTAAEGTDFRLAGIPNPRSVQGLVDRERDRERLRYRA
jgi:hypothetical protein